MSTRVVRAVLVTPLLLAVLGGCVYCSSGSAAGASGDLCGSFGSRRLSRGTRAALRWRRRHPYYWVWIPSGTTPPTPPIPPHAG